MEAEQEQAPAAACCDRPDADTQRPCALCDRPTCANCRCRINEHDTCRCCFDSVQGELQGERAQGRDVPLAVLGGLLGSLLGGVAWAAIAVASDMEIGYVALGIGWLAGQGVLLAAGKRKGRELQYVAVACSVLGLVVGKYFSLAHAIIGSVQRKQDLTLSYLDPEIIRIFIEHASQLFSPWDALWVFLAFGVAWRIPAPSQVQLS